MRSALSALPLVALLTSAGACSAAPAPAPPLEWAACPHDVDLQCATLTVPLDRATPTDPRTVALPVVKGAACGQRGAHQLAVCLLIGRIDLDKPLPPPTESKQGHIA